MQHHRTVLYRLPLLQPRKHILPTTLTVGRFREYYRQTLFSKDAEEAFSCGIGAEVGSIQDTVFKVVTIFFHVAYPLLIKSSFIHADRFPVTIGQFVDIPWVKTVAGWFAWGTPLQTTLYVLMILFFTYFYTAVSVNIAEMSDNIKKYGGFIPGLRPGKPTTDYLDKIMSRITLAGAIFLALIALMPNVVGWITGIEGIYFGGTALLIVVGVALDTMKQVESLVLMRHYQGFMK